MTSLALLAELVSGSSGLATVTAFGLVGVTLLMLAWAVGLVAGMPRADAVAGQAVPVARPVVVRLRDPDTAGRPRPRAPTRSPAPA
ncbi:DUF6412 domain-containing protein [Thermopolyspora sp. NPDC052614]|uniref:DUF6412 domain-containing protein n=1 Tax=Thermopolyspora sp. NPDC052614 TaxID=3155682 RepID=UPI00341D2DBA